LKKLCTGLVLSLGVIHRPHPASKSYAQAERIAAKEKTKERKKRSKRKKGR
jgi:hypothetical protein